VAEADDPRLQIEVAGRTVGEHLDLAIAAGGVVRHEDGRLSARRRGDTADAVRRKGGFLGRRAPTDRSCGFLNDFLFDKAYGGKQVPLGCQDCFKIKVGTRSLRAMMAMKDIAESTPFSTKSGAEVDNPRNPDVYSTYVYFDGLEQAREGYRKLRQRMDAHPSLGHGAVVTIKRGCSNYERNCGPSDRYTFDPRLEAVEAYLRERFVDERPEPESSPELGPSRESVQTLRMMRLIETAYRIGDETYKDFTDGKPLFQPLVSYPPEPETETPSPDP
jgi:hypothetical protein